MGTVDNINPKILRECREQMAYGFEDACKKSGIKTIEKMEAGEKKPTFKQLAALSKLYCVPKWVFISDQIPEEYKFLSSPSFRHIRKSGGADVPAIPRIRQLISKVEGYRRMILEYREDLDDPIPQYSDISYNDGDKVMAVAAVVAAAVAVRKWLGITESLPFEDIRKLVEQKNIFVFKTSNYNHWSKLGTNKFRGFAIYKEVLPMIVINGSDAKNAQSFTLYHELGHILKKKSNIDIEFPPNEEEWCNSFAANALMPADQFRLKISGIDLSELKQIKKLADSFCVSPDACVIRLKQLGEIDSDTCNSYLGIFRKERDATKGRNVRVRRQIHKEVLHRFGGIYFQTVWQAYHDDQIGLHKLCKLFEITRTNVALSMRDRDALPMRDKL